MTGWATPLLVTLLALLACGTLGLALGRFVESTDRRPGHKRGGDRSPMRPLLVALAVAALIVLILVVRAHSNPFPVPATTTTGPAAAPGQPVVVTVPDRHAHILLRRLRHQLQTERRRARRYRHRIRTLNHTLRVDPNTSEAINIACTIYGSCLTLWRRAQCESGVTAHAYNRQSHASGLFQFLPATFASTPFGRFSIWSPYANALAAGWMNANGRGGEWVCR